MSDLLEDMLFYSIAELAVRRNKLGALGTLLDGCFQCFLLHSELVIVHFALVLILQ